MQVLGQVQRFSFDKDQPVSLPANLGWDGVNFNFGVITLSNLYSNVYGRTSVSLETIFNTKSNALLNPTTTYYVSVSSGNDANAGTSAGAAVKSIYQAITLANATGNPAKIIVSAGIYPRVNSFSGASALKPTVDIAVVATGGRVVTGPFDQFSAPTRDATYTNTYSFSLSNALRVLDMQNNNQYGNYVDLVNVSTPTLCNATPNSWVISGGTIYINRADQAAVTNVNTRVVRDARNIIVNADVSLYVGPQTGNDGFDFIGGNNNGVLDFDITTATSTLRACIFKNCTFNYGGGPTATGANGVAVDSMHGIAAFENCQADASWKDGFNFHNVRSSAGVFCLTINCAAVDSGRIGNQSCNGITHHEDCISIDIAGHYKNGRGGTAHSIGTSKTFFAGTYIDTDLGDIILGGNILPQAFRTGDTATYWLDRCKVTGPKNMYAMFTATSGASIYYRNLMAGSLKGGGSGTVAEY